MSRRLVLISIALLLFASCIPPEPDDDVIVDWDPEETVMGEIQQRGELVVGIERESSPYGFLDSSDRPQGFTVEFGLLIADALGVEARFVTADRLKLLTMPGDQKADLTFPLLSITEKRVRQFIFTDPVYVGHQRLLTAEDSSIQDTDDLDGKIVCEADVDPATGLDIEEVADPAKVVAPEASLCGSLVAHGKPGVDAVTGPDPVLVGIAQRFNSNRLHIVGDQLTTEGYGAVIESGASAWQDFVNGVLAEADAEGDWQRFYDKWFEKAEEPTTFPVMTVEEAAALYPKDV